MTAEFSLPIRVYIEDTDAGGIVYYVNYLKYLERARTELMRTFGLERAAVSDAGWNFVVSDVSLSYKEPARLDDQLHATAVISAVGGATVNFHQKVRRDDAVLVAGDIQIACVDRGTGRPTRLDADAAEANRGDTRCHGGGDMTQELGLLELIFGASALVQAVMLILVLASLSSWFLIVQRVMLMRRADDELLVFEEQFWSGIDLAQLYREGNQAVADGQLPTGVESLFRAGFKEFSRLSQQSDMDADAILEGSRRAMRVALMRETDRIEQHLPFLASVGSTSPYIGLLGTVWGIMHSFRGLANATQATLATVAPGISEALIATAMGLFAAIPAVLAYNRLAARSDALLNRYETFLDEFSGILQRQTYALKANQSQRP